MSQPFDHLIARLADQIEQAGVDPRWSWRQQARPEQLIPGGTWRIMYFQGGRGSGKTRSGSGGLAELILADPEAEGEWGIVAPTYRDAWTVCVEGEAGLLRALGTSAGEVKEHRSKMVEYAHRSYGEIGLRNGHTVYVDSADDGALRVQGKNLKGCWCDEIGLWQRWATAWDESVKYAVRKGTSKIITTGTPKVSRPAAKLIRRFLRGDEPDLIVRRLRTIDNIANLSETFFNAVIGRAKGTRLERQELEGELLDDVENALWNRELLEGLQEGQPLLDDGRPAGMVKSYIGVDPSDGTEDSDEQAYTVAAMGNDNLLHITDSWGGQESPVLFAKRVVKVAGEWNAGIIIEKNHGGAWLEPTFRQAMKDLGITRPVKLVSASLGKRTRAEPVAALYERGLVRHAYGPHVELEDQMCIAEGSLIETSRGLIPIEDMQPLDCVATRSGWRPVLKTWGRGTKQTVTIVTSRGKIICTPDHPVYVSGSGWARADEVQRGTKLLSCRANRFARSLSSRGFGTTWMTTDITRPAAAEGEGFFIERYGKMLMVPYRQGGMCIMEHLGVATMIPVTSLRFQPEITTDGISQSGGSQERSLTHSVSGAGNAGMSGHGGRPGITSARNAGNHTSQDPTNRHRIAHGNAVIALWDAAVLSVSESGEQPVYDLSVGGDRHEFFADGLLVHNCSFTGAKGERSPDRLDSLVWACQPFLGSSFATASVRGPASVRRWESQKELEKVAASHEHQVSRRLARAHGGLYDQEQDGWSLDSFAPKAPATRRRVHQWGERSDGF